MGKCMICRKRRWFSKTNVVCRKCLRGLDKRAAELAKQSVFRYGGDQA